MSRGWATLLLGAPLLAGCSEPSPADPVILAFDDLAVRRSEFDAHLAGMRARGLEGAEAPGVIEGVLAAFLEERVLVLEARRRGLLKKEASSEEQQAAARALLSASAAEARVGEAEIEAYYTAHRSDLARPEEISLRQILVPTQNEARDVRRRLSRDPRSFETLAQTRSRGPEASAGGLMGTFARGQLPTELEAAAFALAPGAASEPVESPLGYHVLRVDARTPARERALEECREEIRRLLLREKADAAGKRLVESLLSRAKVNYEAAKSRIRP